MWIYQKNLMFPVNITKPDPRMAKLLMAQYGGPDSELGAALRYLSQRFSMPDDRVKATLTDIGSEASECTKAADAEAGRSSGGRWPRIFTGWVRRA